VAVVGEIATKQRSGARTEPPREVRRLRWLRQACAPQLLDHTDGRPQIFVMRATQRRSDAHAETLADSIAGKLCRGGHDEAGRVGK